MAAWSERPFDEQGTRGAAERLISFAFGRGGVRGPRPTPLATVLFPVGDAIGPHPSVR